MYANHAPQTAENFVSFATGNNPERLSYAGSSFDKGFPGMCVVGGCLSEDNHSVDGRRMTHENTQLRHFKRGMLSLTSDGDNGIGSKFLITLGQAADILDGYNVVIGELVEGEDVLNEVEKSLSREWNLKNEIKIESSGTR